VALPGPRLRDIGRGGDRSTRSDSNRSRHRRRRDGGLDLGCVSVVRDRCRWRIAVAGAHSPEARSERPSPWPLAITGLRADRATISPTAGGSAGLHHDHYGDDASRHRYATLLDLNGAQVALIVPPPVWLR